MEISLRTFSPLAFVLPLVLSATIADARSADMTIVEQGKPVATIVVAQAANPKARLAAEDLQKYLEKISGAKLAIVTDAEIPRGPLILVGKSRLTDEIGAASQKWWKLCLPLRAPELSFAICWRLPAVTLTQYTVQWTHLSH